MISKKFANAYKDTYKQRPLEYDLGSSLAEDAEAGLVVQLNDGAHRLALRVERVNLEQFFLRYLDPVVLIV